MIHITPALKKITEEGNLYASGGCLGSAIYCTLMHKDYTPHNLVSVLSDFQLPLKHNQIDLLLIRIYTNKEHTKNFENSGINYINFGTLHCQVWKEIKNKDLFNQRKQENLEKKVVEKIYSIKEKLDFFTKSDQTNFNDFERYYADLFSNTPELRFIPYETLTEYVLLWQDSPTAKKYLKSGELFTFDHKKLIFELCPNMNQNIVLLS